MLQLKNLVVLATCCAGLLLVFGLGSTAFAQQRPLLTEDVEIIKPGTIRFELGFDFEQRAKFPVSGLTGDLTRIGNIGINIGLAPNVELQIDGTLQNFLSIDRFGPSSIPLTLGGNRSTNDTGDFTISTKIKLRNETEKLPAFGLRIGIELPNSNQAKGLGLNTTNVFGALLAQKHFGRMNLFGNVGLGILQNPLQTFSQNDVLLYGLATIVRINNRFNIVGEVNGRHSTRKAQLGTEDRSTARLGFQLSAAGLRFDAASIFGLSKFSPRTGVTFGVSYDFPAFTPVK